MMRAYCGVIGLIPFGSIALIDVFGDVTVGVVCASLIAVTVLGLCSSGTRRTRVRSLADGARSHTNV